MTDERLAAILACSSADICFCTAACMFFMLANSPRLSEPWIEDMTPAAADVDRVRSEGRRGCASLRCAGHASGQRPPSC